MPVQRERNVLQQERELPVSSLLGGEIKTLVDRLCHLAAKLRAVRLGEKLPEDALRELVEAGLRSGGLCECAVALEAGEAGVDPLPVLRSSLQLADLRIAAGLRAAAGAPAAAAC